MRERSGYAGAILMPPQPFARLTLRLIYRQYSVRS
jgi:hypothetical protein